MADLEVLAVGGPADHRQVRAQLAWSQVDRSVLGPGTGERLAVRYQRAPDSAGPSWLTVLGHAKDSLWSLDLFRCESALLRTHWVLVVMDQCTRRIVGFTER